MPTVLSRMAMQLEKNSLDNARLHGFGMFIISGNPGDRRLLSQLVFLRHCQPYFDAHHEANSHGRYDLAFVGIIDTALFALYAMLFWLAFL